MARRVAVGHDHGGLLDAGKEVPMRHTWWQTMVWLLLFTLGAEAQEITLFTWEDYIAPEVVAEFERQTGIQVRQVYYDSDKSRDEILASSRGREFDVVVIDSIGTLLFGKTNRLLALSLTEVPNLVNIAPEFADSCGNFGVPYFWGTLGLLYDKTRYPQPPDSWQALLDPAPAHQGHVAMIEDPIDILVPPLLMLGYNINSENEQELREAYGLLKKQIPHVLNYRYALTNLSSGQGKNLHLALGYSGDQYSLNEEIGGEDWQFVIPREGTSIWVDCLTVPAWSDRSAQAKRFLDFVTDGKQAARNMREISVSSPNEAVLAHLDAETKKDPELFPSPEQLAKGQHYRIISDASMRQRNRILGSLIKQREAQ
jgi:spermidine/putrescine transport system substrate-binding protein